MISSMQIALLMLTSNNGGSSITEAWRLQCPLHNPTAQLQGWGFIQEALVGQLLVVWLARLATSVKPDKWSTWGPFSYARVACTFRQSVAHSTATVSGLSGLLPLEAQGQSSVGPSTTHASPHIPHQTAWLSVAINQICVTIIRSIHMFIVLYVCTCPELICL